MKDCHLTHLNGTVVEGGRDLRLCSSFPILILEMGLI